jgi:hypothetical protein
VCLRLACGMQQRQITIEVACTAACTGVAHRAFVRGWPREFDGSTVSAGHVGLAPDETLHGHVIGDPWVAGLAPSGATEDGHLQVELIGEQGGVVTAWYYSGVAKWILGSTTDRAFYCAS